MVENGVQDGSGGLSPLVVEVRLVGELTVEALRDALGEAEQQVRAASGPVSLLVDASEMTGYEGEARTEFIRWNAAHRDRIGRVAIVTRRLAWRMVIAGMSLAARQDFRPFSDVASARSWAAQPT